MSAQILEHGHRQRDRIVCSGDHRWVAWVERVSRELRLPIPTLIDVSIAAYANGRGLEPAPQRLNGGQARP